MIKLVPLMMTNLKPHVQVWVNPAFVTHVGYNGGGSFCVFSGRGNAPIEGNLDHLPAPFSSWPLFIEVERDGKEVPVRINPAAVFDVSDARFSYDIGDPPEIQYPEGMPESLKEIAAKAVQKVLEKPVNGNAKTIIAVGIMTLPVTASVSEAVAILTGQPVPLGPQRN